MPADDARAEVPVWKHTDCALRASRGTLDGIADGKMMEYDGGSGRKERVMDSTILCFITGQPAWTGRRLF